MDINVNNYNFFLDIENELPYLNMFTKEKTQYDIQEESTKFCHILIYLINNNIKIDKLKIEVNLFFNIESIILFSNLVNRNNFKLINIITNSKIEIRDKYGQEDNIVDFLKCFDNLFKSIDSITICNLEYFIIQSSTSNFDINWPCLKPVVYIYQILGFLEKLLQKDKCKIKHLSLKYFSFGDINNIYFHNKRNTPENIEKILINIFKNIERFEIIPFYNDFELDYLKIIDEIFIEKIINVLTQNNLKLLKMITFPDLIIPYNYNECQHLIDKNEFYTIIKYSKVFAHIFLPGLLLKIHFKNITSMKNYLFPKLLLSILYTKCFFSNNIFCELPIEIKQYILLYLLPFLNNNQIVFICDELISSPKKFKNNIIKIFNKTFIIDINYI